MDLQQTVRFSFSDLLLGRLLAVICRCLGRHRASAAGGGEAGVRQAGVFSGFLPFVNKQLLCRGRGLVCHVLSSSEVFWVLCDSCTALKGIKRPFVIDTCHRLIPHSNTWLLFVQSSQTLRQPPAGHVVWFLPVAPSRPSAQLLGAWFDLWPLIGALFQAGDNSLLWPTAVGAAAVTELQSVCVEISRGSNRCRRRRALPPLTASAAAEMCSCSACSSLLHLLTIR